MSTPGLTSTTAPGKIFASRAELAEHYKSDWHKYNLKRREAGLPLLTESDFQTRLEAAMALKKEQSKERTGKDHLKKKKERKNTKKQREVTVKSQAAAYDRLKAEGNTKDSQDEPDHEETMEEVTTTVEEEQEATSQAEEPPVIEPRQCLFDKHVSASVQANVERMQRKYGFFLPDREYLVDVEGLVGYCHEKIKLGHYCLYCQRVFSTWQGCQKHMISTRHTKLRYEEGIDLEEYEPFYDFSEANQVFLGGIRRKGSTNVEDEEEDVHMEEDDDGWVDISDDEEEVEGMEDEELQDEEDMMQEDEYAAYEEEIANYGFDVTPLGELILPDGRIIGHRGLARYYKQRPRPQQDGQAVVAARRAAGERVYNGRVYNVGRQAREGSESTSLVALSRAGVGKGASAGQGKGVLVASGGGGFTAVSLYRYRAVVKKARRDDARGQRLQNKTKQNMNRMDKKANRLMNNVSVAHAPR